MTIGLETLSSEENNNEVVATQSNNEVEMSVVATQTDSLAIQSSSCQTENLALGAPQQESKDRNSEKFHTPKGGAKNEPKFTPVKTRSKNKK